MLKNYRDWIRWCGMTLNLSEDRACRYLEGQGLRFGYEFGRDNCVQMARDHWRKRKQRKTRKAAK